MQHDGRQAGSDAAKAGTGKSGVENALETRASTLTGADPRLARLPVGSSARHRRSSRQRGVDDRLATRRTRRAAITRRPECDGKSTCAESGRDGAPWRASRSEMAACSEGQAFDYAISAPGCPDDSDRPARATGRHHPPTGEHRMGTAERRLPAAPTSTASEALSRRVDGHPANNCFCICR